jgi:hypothetical protein
MLDTSHGSCNLHLRFWIRTDALPIERYISFIHVFPYILSALLYTRGSWTHCRLKTRMIILIGS